ncbi:unnamed protein product [Psylliodes chrysocephalus]|uniref:CUB domain-containing protein n=1 Tax=Psylliodes chrysocephalus TaxID=3402493 RepID=A0A9P0G7Q1_9CUCU|nr:unnamed protein product [Psylliodes chrysocephala]
MAPDNRYTSGRRLVLSILCLQAICLQVTSECDQTFVSRPGGPMNGTFHSPEFENPRSHSRNCVYTFLAGPGQRVQVSFISFNLRGRPPDQPKRKFFTPEMKIRNQKFYYDELKCKKPGNIVNSALIHFSDRNERFSAERWKN